MSATCDMDKNVDFLRSLPLCKGKRRAYIYACILTRSRSTFMCVLVCVCVNVQERDRELDIKTKVIS